MNGYRTIGGWRAASLLTAVVSLASATDLLAHDLPNQIVIQAFVKPEGDRLHFVLRLPLTLLLNMDLPKRGPGYLELAHIEDALEASAAAAAEQFVLYDGQTPLSLVASATRITLPADKSFASYREAVAHIHGPKLPVNTDVFWNQGFFDAHLEYPIASDGADFSLDAAAAPGLADHLTTVVRFIPPAGSERAFKLAGNAGRVALDPRWYQAGWLFVKSGFFHILTGFDHLLFLLCLVIPLRCFRGLLVVVTSFTVAHSITLIASALGAPPAGAWFSPLIETLIAATIVYMAIENIVATKLERRWIITFAFGLVHGFGFSFALRETLQLSGSHLLLSLVSFNVGVELGQIAVLAVLLPVLALLFQRGVAERIITVLLSVLVAHTAWHWLIDRSAELSRAEWPVLDTALVTTLARWLLLVLLVGGVGWLAARGWRRSSVESPHTEEEPA